MDLRKIFILPTEKPVEPKFYGHLTLGHNVPNGTQYILNKDVILINDYSMIVATRPDPTVRPPSRYFNPVLPHIFYGFLSKIQ